jgi:hypothetical protein
MADDSESSAMKTRSKGSTSLGSLLRQLSSFGHGSGDTPAVPKTAQSSEIKDAENAASRVTGSGHTVARRPSTVVPRAPPPSLISLPPPPPSPFFDLPQELLDEILSYLDPAHVVVLALTNKDMFHRFLRHHQLSPNEQPQGNNNHNSISLPSSKPLGEYIAKADSASSSSFKMRGTLLSLLDRAIPDLVYCYKCKRMHSPYVTFQDPIYAPQKSPRCIDYSLDHHVPPRATRKMLRTVTKIRNLGAPGWPLVLNQVNNTTTTYKGGCMVQVTLRIRFRENKLLLRRQHVVATVEKSPRALWLMTRILRGREDSTLHPGQAKAPECLPRVHKACHHNIWSDRYAVLLDGMVNPFCREKGGAEPVAVHGPLCFSEERWDARSQEGHAIHDRFEELSRKPSPRHNSSPDAGKPGFGDVVGCDKCTTDLSMDVVELPPPFGWGFALSAWMDLGAQDFSPEWESQREPRYAVVYRRRPEQMGRICRAFERLTGEKRKGLPFLPYINEVNLARMGHWGWGEMATRGVGIGSSWSSGHETDPATGRITDPDELEIDDTS